MAGSSGGLEKANMLVLPKGATEKDCSLNTQLLFSTLSKKTIGYKVIVNGRKLDFLLMKKVTFILAKKIFLKSTFRSWSNCSSTRFFFRS